ncbi:MAG: sigma-70 family RNA polymerase sigma factor [Gemmatimonadota bacterium]
MSSADAARLFDEHHASLFRYLLRLTGDADVAHDAAQETFTRYVQKPPRNEHPRAWLFTVATNIVRAASLQRQRRATLLAGGAGRATVADPLPDPEQATLASERRNAVRLALDSLPERERTVLLMREEGFTHREIAAAVQTTTGSVGTMIARALDKLAAALPIDLQETP